MREARQGEPYGQAGRMVGRAREVRRGVDRDVAVGQEVDVDAERVQSRIVCPAMSVESDEFKIEDESTIPWD